MTKCAKVLGCLFGISASLILLCRYQYGLHQDSSLRILAAGSAGLDLRVVKGFGTRPYSSIRISVITQDPEPPVRGFFDYSARFMYKWQQNYLHSTLAVATPGVAQVFNLSADVSVKLPAQGAGVAGVLIADPCVVSPNHGNWIPCPYGESLRTFERTPELISTFAGSSDTDYWGILGDNFYDRYGLLTTEVFGRISLAAKSKFFVTTIGNHDIWVAGTPHLSTTSDQCGNGFMQYYAQDAKAAETVLPGSPAPPFNFSIDPDANRTFGFFGCNLPAISNGFWYHQLGNVGLVGQHGAYSLEAARPFMQEACAWVAKQPMLELVVLLGHWDISGLGASTDMAMPEWYAEMAAMPGCDVFHGKDMLKFVMGHTHCNDPHPYGNAQGFRVAGFGMDGCGNYGVPILDTTGGRVRFWYFDTSTDELYSAAVNCTQSKGWRGCTNLATLWLDQPLAATVE